MARDDPQINVRQTPSRYAVLEAAAFVKGKGTPRKLVQELVDEAIDGYAELASVKKALEARHEQAAVDDGAVGDLSAKRAQLGSKRRAGTKSASRS